MFLVSPTLAVWNFPVKSWTFLCSSTACTWFASDSSEDLSLVPLWAVVLRDVPSSITTQSILGGCTTRSWILSGCIGTRSYIVIHKQGTGEQKGRHVTRLPSQRSWICFCVRNMIGLSKVEWMAYTLGNGTGFCVFFSDSVKTTKFFIKIEKENKE